MKWPEQQKQWQARPSRVVAKNEFAATFFLLLCQTNDAILYANWAMPHLSRNWFKHDSTSMML